MPEPKNRFQLLSRFVRDHKEEHADLILDAATVRELALAIEHSLKVGTEFVDAMRKMRGEPPYVATYEEIYGEPEPA